MFYKVEKIKPNKINVQTIDYSLDENQRVCASIFPVAFVLMQNNPVIEIVRPITSLIGLAVANNGKYMRVDRTCVTF